MKPWRIVKSRGKRGLIRERIAQSRNLQRSQRCGIVSQGERDAKKELLVSNKLGRKVVKPRHCGLRRTVKSRGKTQQRIAKNRRYRSIASRNAKSQFAGRSTRPQFAGRNTPLQFAGRKSQLSQKYRKSQFAKSQSRRSRTQF